MSNRTTYASFPLPTVLGVAFIVLKLTGVIAWSWWWVLAPFWIPVAILLLILIPVLAITLSRRAAKTPRRGKGVGRHRR